MKRFIKYIFIFISMFLFTNIVKAPEAECVYSGSWGTVTITYKDTKFNFGATGGMYRLTNKDITARSIMNTDGSLYCPDTIFYSPGYSGDESVVQYDFSFNSGLSSVKIKSQKIQNDTPTTPSEEKDIVCSYGNHTLTFNNNTQKVSVTTSYNIYNTVLYNTLKMFDYECPPKICFHDLQNGEFQVNFSNGTCFNKSGAINDPSDDGDGGNPIDGTPIDPGSPPSCADFQEITGPIWFWIKIIGPVLAVVFGTMDLLRAVAASDEKGTKKAVSDFGKRLALCALLFLLHIIVNMLVGFTSYGGVGSCL